MEAKKLMQEEEAEEDDYARTQRMRQLELEADMMSATELFSGVSIGIYRQPLCLGIALCLTVLCRGYEGKAH